MARIRTVKPELFRHEGLFDAEVRAGLPLRVAFCGLMTAADRAGRFRWRPRQLKLDVLPYDELDFERVLLALAAEGFITRYEVDGEVYGAFPSWDTHQVINNRESESRLPAPPEAARVGHASSTGAARVDDAMGTPQVHAQGEGEGEREGEGESEGDLSVDSQPRGQATTASRTASAKARHDYSPDFEVLWETYPCKKSKAEAAKVFAGLKPSLDLRAEMLQAVKIQARSAQWTKDGGQYVPHLATWLKKERWKDEVTCPPSAGDIFEGCI